MKQLKLTALRKAVLLIVAVVLVSCLTITFVACNNDDDNGSSNGEISVPLQSIDSTTFNQALNGMLGYLCANYEGYDDAYISGQYVKGNEYYAVSKEEFTLGLVLENEEDDADVEDIRCYVLLYKTEQNATESLEDVEEEFEGCIVTQDKSIIIIESEEGLYTSIKSSALPTDSTSKAQINFFNDVLKKELNANNEIVSIHCEGALDDIYIYAMPVKGNLSRTYQTVSEAYITAMEASLDDIDLSTYTSDSYAKAENGAYFIYLQPKAGFTFEETEDETGYAITYYYYAEAPETLVLPATYNNKPVVKIAYLELPEETTALTIPASVVKFYEYICYDAENLKTINYQGTKAQWEEMNLSTYALRHVNVIHCSDEDIVLNQD